MRIRWSELGAVGSAVVYNIVFIASGLIDMLCGNKDPCGCGVLVLLMRMVRCDVSSCPAEPRRLGARRGGVPLSAQMRAVAKLSGETVPVRTWSPPKLDWLINWQNTS